MGPNLNLGFGEKSKISPKFHTLFHWKAIERAFRKTTGKDKISRFKLIHQKWATNMVQAGWDSEKTPLCQRCTDREETFHHIFACTSINAS